MGVLRSTQSLQAEVDELRASLLVENGWRPSGVRVDAKRAPGGAAARTVCVTGGISFIGFAVVDRLLRHGYTVRLALETQGQPPVPSRLSLSLCSVAFAGCRPTTWTQAAVALVTLLAAGELAKLPVVAFERGRSVSHALTGDRIIIRR
jgi:hypothetical protein